MIRYVTLVAMDNVVKWYLAPIFYFLLFLGVMIFAVHKYGENMQKIYDMPSFRAI